MTEVIEKWLLNSIGVYISLSPSVIGEACFDGTLFSKILLKYKICSPEYINNMSRQYSFDEAYANLKLLSVWFKLLQIPFDDELLMEIAGKKDSPALRLLYELFLKLENKESMRLVDVKEIERRLAEPTDKFLVRKVTEARPKGEISYDKRCIIETIDNGQDIIEKYLKKETNFQNICLEESRKRRVAIIEELSKNKTISQINEPGSACQLALCSAKDIDIFKGIKETDYNLNKLRQLTSDRGVVPCKPKDFISFLKDSRRKKEAGRIWREKIIQDTLDEAWNEMLMKREDKSRDVLSKKLLKRAECEKQMSLRLRRCRDIYKTFIDNRKVILETEEKGNLTSRFLESYRTSRNEDLKKIENTRIQELYDTLQLENDRIRYERNYKECSSILNDIIDFAIVNHEYRIGLRAKPSKKKVMSWKLMFIIGIPLFVCHDSDDTRCIQSVRIQDKRSEILGEYEFHLYNCLIGPWGLRNFGKSRKCKRKCKPRCKCGCKFRKSMGEPKEVDKIGNIVHRLLDLKYSYNMAFGKPAEVPKYAVQALLSPVNSPYVINKLKSFLQNQSIAIVDVNGATNYVVDAYKEYAKAQSPRKGNLEPQYPSKVHNHRTSTRHLSIKREEQLELMKKRTFIEKLDYNKHVDAIVQVPEEIKETVPRKVALGSIVMRHLSKGLLLSDIITCEIILEYIKSLKDIKGWVLLNFPNNLKQVATMEYLFSGREVPFMQYFTDNIYLKLKSEFKFIDEPIPDEKITKLDQTYTQAEELLIRQNHPSMSDIIFSKRSNIVPKSSVMTQFPHFKSIFSKVIRVEFCRQEEVLSEADDLEEEDGGEDEDSPLFSRSIDEFYEGLHIFVRFSIDKLNPNTLITLARVLINEAPNEWCPGWKNNVDLFGFEKFVQTKPPSITMKDSRAAVPKPNVRDLFMGAVYSRPKLELLTKALFRVKAKRKQEKKETTSKKSQDSPIVVNIGNSATEKYITKAHYEPLASIWESIEYFYIFNMTETLHRLSLIDSQFIPYRNFIVMKAEQCIKLNDDRKRIVSNFQLMLNSVSDNLRQVKTMKNELHYRVQELQKELWKISNVKKIFCNDILRRLINDNWLPKQLCNYLKCYSSLLQVEVDRFVHTMQFITDYYSVCSTEEISNLKPSKIFLPKFEYEKIDPRKGTKQQRKLSIKLSARSSAKQSLKQPAKPSTKRGSKPVEKGVKNGKQSKSRPTKKTDLEEPTIINCASSLEKRDSAFHLLRGLLARLRIRTLAINDSYKKISRDTRYNQMGINSLQRSASSSEQEESFQWQQFPSEEETIYNDWADTLQEEMDRLLFRLELVEAHAKKTMRAQIRMIKCAFKYYEIQVLDRFHKERFNIDRLCDLFRVAIEEEVKIQPSIILDDDQFYVDPDKLMYPNPSPPEPRALEEVSNGHQMTAFQLTNFHRKMSYVAPIGVLKNTFTYILQEMATFGQELCYPYLPRIWSYLDTELIQDIINDWFGDKSVICWKDFIIFALDYTYPSLEEIIIMKEQFEAHDPEHSELITNEQFMNSILWLDNRRTLGLEQTLRCIKLKELLFELFQVNTKQMNYTCFLLSICRDENPKVGLVKALAATNGLLTVSWSRHLLDEKENKDRENDKYYISKSILQEIVERVYEIEDVKMRDKIDENKADLYQFMWRQETPSTSHTVLSENNEEEIELFRSELIKTTVCHSESSNSSIPFEWKNVLTDFKSSSDFLNYDVHFDTVLSIFIFCLQYCAISPDHAYHHVAIEKNLNKIFSEKGDGYTIKLGFLLDNEFIEKLLTSYRLFHAVNITQYLNLFNKSESIIAEEYEMQ